VADYEFQGLFKSIAAYFVAMILLMVIVATSVHDKPLGDAMVAGVQAPLFIIFFFMAPAIIDSWVAYVVVFGTIGAICAALARLRGKVRIATILTLLTVAYLYGLYAASTAGA
jgi:hypothetical protein